jgi:hypothetical protein
MFGRDVRVYLGTSEILIAELKAFFFSRVHCKKYIQYVYWKSCNEDTTYVA